MVDDSTLTASTTLQVVVLRFPDGSLDVEVHWQGAPPPGDHIVPAMATAAIAACNATIVESLGVRLSPVVGVGPDEPAADEQGPPPRRRPPRGHWLGPR